MFVLDEDQETPPDVVVPISSGCDLVFSPVTPAMMIGARRAYRAALADLGRADAERVDIEATGDEAYAALGLYLAKRGLKSWTGIGNRAGEPIPATPEGLVKFIAMKPAAFQQIERDYIAPVLALEMEKNVSPASATGTSRSAAGNTAKAARTKVKRNPALPAPTAASAARTGRTSRKPTQA